MRVFLSPGLWASRDGDSAHGVGATAVREMYAADLETRVGWSAMVKTEAGWFWYERFDRQPAPPVASHEAPGCVGCHSGGRDFLMPSGALEAR